MNKIMKITKAETKKSKDDLNVLEYLQKHKQVSSIVKAAGKDMNNIMSASWKQVS